MEKNKKEYLQTVACREPEKDPIDGSLGGRQMGPMLGDQKKNITLERKLGGRGQAQKPTREIIPLLSSPISIALVPFRPHLLCPLALVRHVWM